MPSPPNNRPPVADTPSTQEHRRKSLTQLQPENSTITREMIHRMLDTGLSNDEMLIWMTGAGYSNDEAYKVLDDLSSYR